MNSIKIMPKGALRTWIERLQSRDFKVVGPKALHGQFVFEEIADPEELVIDYPMSAMPPKKYLLPPREVLFSFNTKTMEMEAEITAEPTVIIGVHTCDMHAINLLDTVQSTGFADQHYRARRDATYLVSIECLKPCNAQCFCKDMETFSVPEDHDLHFTDLGDVYSIHIGSEKGEELLRGSTNVWTPTEADLQRLNEVMAAKWPEFEFRLECDLHELPEVLGATQHSPLWDELGEICLSCGACTQVCPTCYCFDVTDEVDLTLENGQRVRTWDSCQLEKFALVAGNHNFRSGVAARQRHRFTRKVKYQYEAFGTMGCVGCGRCGTACHVDITCIKTYNRLYDEYQAKSAEPVAADRTNGHRETNGAVATAVVTKETVSEGTK